MNKNRLYDFYFALPPDSTFGIISKATNRIIGKIVKKYLDGFMPKIYAKKAGQTKNNNANKITEKRVIASLTSFPGRINEIWICIESILRQSVKPDKIVLWLAEEQFPDKVLPVSLTNLFDKGVEIRWCDEDLRSHKKYFYALKEFPQDIVILFDDDLYYPDQLIENLLYLYQKHPDRICATRVHKMTFNNDGIKPYREWNHNYNPKSDDCDNLFFTSGAGTLFPPMIMPQKTFDSEVFKKICFYADDVWLNLNAIDAKIKVVSNNKYNKDEITIGKTQKQKLVSQNVISGGNDTQIKAVLEYLNLRLSE